MKLSERYIELSNLLLITGSCFSFEIYFIEVMSERELNYCSSIYCSLKIKGLSIYWKLPIAAKVKQIFKSFLNPADEKYIFLFL